MTQRREHLASLLLAAADGDLTCLHRPHGALPEWLDLCLYAAESSDPDDRNRLQRAIRHASHQPGFDESLHVLADQSARIIIAARGAVVPELMGGPAPGSPVQTVVFELRNRWLYHAAQQADLQHLRGDWAWNPGQPPAASQACRLPVLLVAHGTLGLLAQLRLWRVPHPGGGLKFVPIPATSVTPLKPLFQDSLDQVSAWLRQELEPLAEPAGGLGVHPADHVLAWDLAPLGVTLASLDGDSAGAAFALGAAWLMRRFAPPALREPLARITEGTLQTIGVTAAVDADGGLHKVGGLEAKTHALTEYQQWLKRPVPLYVAGEQTLHLPALGADPPVIHRPNDMHALIRRVADGHATLGPAQALVHDWLLGRAGGVKPSLQVLQQAAAAERTDLRHHALACCARWAQEQRGELHLRFTPLALATSSLSGAGASGRQTWGGLENFLLEAETPDETTPAEEERVELPPRCAYLLRGAPGSGKTTLLQHLQQRLCVKMLQALADGKDPAEVPLLLALSTLPAASPAALEDDDIARSEIRQWVRTEARKCSAELADLLDAQTRPGAHLAHIRVRLLLDGLNELKVAPDQDREERARTVVGVCLNLLGEDANVPLLATREHHPFELRDRNRDPVLTLDVLPWGKDQIQPYLDKRFAKQPELARQLWVDLSDPRNAAALDLCRVPMNLDGQCELFEHPKGGRLFTERASLLTAWLWQRLSRETESFDGRPVNPLLKQDWLLHRRDRERISRREQWLGHALRQLPCVGALLPTLMEQAARQWREAGPDKPEGVARGEVRVDVGTVAPKLPAPQREAWLQAVQDLGLARVEDGLFFFSHQSWGEFLASLNLLPADTPESDRPEVRQAVQRLLNEIRPSKLARTDAEEIAHLRQQVAQHWERVPQAFWDRLLKDGVTIPLHRLHRFLDPQFDRRGALTSVAQSNIQWLRQWAGFTEHAPSGSGEVLCSVSLREWGRHQPRVNRHGADWWHQPQAWAELVQGLLWQPFRDAFWPELERLLGERPAQQLLEVGQLALPPAGDLDEPMLLALQALPRPEAWLERLCAEGQLRMAARAVLGIHNRLEPRPWESPNPLIQHLRWLLLLRSVDGGHDVRDRVLASGLARAMKEAGSEPGDRLHEVRCQALDRAFDGPGVDVRLRIEAGLLLGELGDTLRYQRWPATDGKPGLRLRDAHWIGTGEDVHAAMASGGVPRARQFRIGDDGRGDANEKPAFPLELPGLAIAAYAVTVAEWKCFVEADGYRSEDDPWWAEQGPAAQAWLRQVNADAPAGVFRPRALDRSAYNNPAQPMVGITWFEAVAYARWAGPMVHRPGDLWQLRVPTEVEWEAGVRGPATARNQALSWPHPEGDGEPDALCFNHADTCWGRTTPVGVFSRGYAAAGVADAAGNQWEWCANQYEGRYQPSRGKHAGGPEPAPTDPSAPRALRGGVFNFTADVARVGYRLFSVPGNVNLNVGLRLVRVWLPHL